MDFHRHIRYLLTASLITLTLASADAHAQEWRPIGLPGVAVTALARVGLDIMASGPRSLHRSSDDTTWLPVAGFGGFRRIETGRDGLVVAASTTSLAISTDAGGTWSTLRDAALRDSLGVIWSHVVIPGTSTIVLGTTSDLLVSEDKGASWQSRNVGLPVGSPHVGALAVTIDGGLVGGTQGIFGGNLYMAPAGIGEWIQIYQRPATETGEATAVFSTTDGAVLAAISERGIIRSGDEGATWTDASAELGDGELVRTFVGHGAELFAVTSTGRILVSNDDGFRWQAGSTTGLPQGGALTLLPLGENRYVAGTSNGVYELGAPAGVEVETAAAARFTLAPLPSRDGALRLRRDNPSSAARIEVIDAVGRLVRSIDLVPGVANASVDGLASGIYLVRLVDGARAETRTAVVAR
jgi:photosystem II stability/assembly factor-like uncharacterized protein